LQANKGGDEGGNPADEDEGEGAAMEEFLLLDDVIEEGNDIDLKDKHTRKHKDGSVSAFSVLFKCPFSRVPAAG
jgi:hypothetical protein